MTRQKKVLHNIFFTRFETFLPPYQGVFLMSPECILMVFPCSRQFWCIKSLYSATKHGCPNIFISDIKQFSWVLVRYVISWGCNLCDQILHFSANLDIKHQFYIGVMVKSIFAKITDAKRFFCFLMIKNTPAERKSPWDNHKSLRSFSSICTSCSSSHSSNTSSAAQTFVVIPGTFPSSWGVFYR